MKTEANVLGQYDSSNCKSDNWNSYEGLSFDKNSSVIISKESFFFLSYLVSATNSVFFGLSVTYYCYFLMESFFSFLSFQYTS